jgi:hypothetical protein
MELWEAAILVVGGIWLIGKVSRNSPNHPVTASMVAANPTQPAGNTVGINTDGSNNLVWGEPLAPPVAPLAQPNVGLRTITSPAAHAYVAPAVSHAIMQPIPMRFNPVPTVPVPVKTVAASSFPNRVPVRGKFLDL